MRFCWDEQKDILLKMNRNRGSIGFEEVVKIFSFLHYEAIRNDDPEQFLAIGWVNGTLYSLIYEEREDDQGPYRHLITFWKSSKKEHELYAKYS